MYQKIERSVENQSRISGSESYFVKMFTPNFSTDSIRNGKYSASLKNQVMSGQILASIISLLLDDPWHLSMLTQE